MSLSLIFILIWKIVDIVIGHLAPSFLNFKGFFSYTESTLLFSNSEFIRHLANFDGVFFIRIAEKGYSYTEQAYFPLYPIMIRVFSLFNNNPLVSGMIISHLCFIIGFFAFRAILPRMTKLRYINPIMIMLLAYPTSYYFGVLYTEGLFFALFTSTLLFLSQKKYFVAFILAYFTSLTRVVGVFIIIPLLTIAAYQDLLKPTLSVQSILSSLRQNYQTLIVALAPLLGLLSYCSYLWLTLGDPLYFIRAQESFGANRSTHFITPIQVIYRYLKIILTADLSFQYGVAMIELIFFIFAILILCYDLYQQLRENKFTAYRLGLNFFSWINILLPAVTGTLTAIPRYTLMSLTIMLTLGELNNSRIKYAWFSLSVIAHLIMFSYFIQGYYVT